MNNNTSQNTEPNTNWEASTLTKLIGHLLSHHHPYTKARLEELAPLLDKVVSVHGEQHPELIELRKLFTELRDDLVMHLKKEENILFPYMLDLEATPLPSASHFGSVENPIRMLTIEHHNDGLIMHNMLKLTNDFALPADACTSFTLLYTGLLELVRDLQQHIYLENNILFPRAIDTEANKLRQAQT